MTLAYGPKLGLLIHAAYEEEHYDALTKMLRGIDALVQCTVKNHTLDTPPVGPDDGDCYIVPVAATGEWSGHDKKIGRWSAVIEEWEFYTPKAGWIAWSDEAGTHIAFDGSTWVAFPVVAVPAFEWPDDFLPSFITAFQNAVLSNSDKTVTSGSGEPNAGSAVGRSGAAVAAETNNKVYVEFQINASSDGTGGIALGLINKAAAATLQDGTAYANPGDSWIWNLVGESIALKGSGDVFRNNTGAGVWYGFSVGDIVGIALDVTLGKVWFTIDGVPSVGEDPATGVGGWDIDVSEDLHLFVGMKNAGHEVTLITEYGMLNYRPSGFDGWSA